MKGIEHVFKAKLEERKKTGNLRSLQSFEGFVDFLSNDYLSLSAEKGLPSSSNSPGSSRLIAGTSKKHLELEQICASFFNGESALLYNSGYTANIGILSTLPQRGDVIIYDENIHASCIDGMRLSHAKRYKFKHNNLKELANQLKLHKESRCFVLVESLYSMGGDFAPLQEINQLCDQQNAHLIVDEAHSGGVFGKNGEGYCVKKGIDPFLRIFTFGKAFGSHGACVVASKTTINYLINFSRSFIYTTALGEQSITRTLHLLSTVEFQEQQHSLATVISHFNQLFSTFNCSSDSDSPIKIIEVST